jgi:hypothetical protein
MTSLRIIHVFGLVSLFISSCACAGPVVNNGDRKTTKQEESANLMTISKLLLLDETDAKQYRSNLQNLVGNYYQIKEQNGINVIELLGRATENLTVDKIEIKDSVLFNRITDENYQIGISIPWLNLKANSGEKLETIIQDMAAVTAPSTAQFIKDHLPQENVLDTSRNVYYISGATVTLISQKRYTTKQIDGAIPIVSIGGRAIYTDNLQTNSYIVSVTKTLAMRATTGSHLMASGQGLYTEDPALDGLVVKVSKSK